MPLNPLGVAPGPGMSQPGGILKGSFCSLTLPMPPLTGLLTFAEPSPELVWYILSAGGVYTDVYDVYVLDIVGIDEVAWL